MNAKLGSLLLGVFFFLSGCATTGASCGDEIIQEELSETCDDGNAFSGDGCSRLCRIEVCGDGEIGVNEECDDANQNDTDACRNNCVLADCGDGVVQAGVESCDDGNQSNNDACVQCELAACGDGFVQQAVEECDNGNNNSDTISNACRTNCSRAGCGDTVIDINETCDDGNNIDTDTCTGVCLGSRCGDGIVFDANGNGVVEVGDEACDDGNFINGDACLTTCLVARCGDGVIRGGLEQCDDANQNNFDGCNNNCQLVGAVCGNGVRENTEACDNGAQNSNVLADACRTNCTLPDCGDGVVDSGEECDDENLINGDGCSGVCLLQVIPESEANDTSTAADGPVSPNAIFSGNLVPAGDLDFFQIEMTSPGELLVESNDNTGANLCDSANNLFLDLFAADATTILSKNDNGGASGCALLRQRLDAGTYFIRLKEIGAVNGVNAYQLTLTQLSRCGDSGVQAAEECDDSNVTNGDGCSALCQREAINLTESEANDTTVTADGPISVSANFAGNIGGGADALDLVSLQLSATSDLSLEIEPALTPSGLCDDTPVGLRLLSSTGITLAQALASGDLLRLNLCTQLDPRDDFGVLKLPAGTYFIEVSKGTLTTGKDYRLHVNILSTCGNGGVEGTEECDDNDQQSGDGCSSQCLLENVSLPTFVESEPNDDGAISISGVVNGNDFSSVNADGNFTADAMVIGALSTPGDEDVFRITNAGAVSKSVSAEVFGPDGIGTCRGIDPVVTLHNTAGTQLNLDDSNGVNFCSLLAFTLAPGETVFIRVLDFNDNAIVRGYQLLIDFL
jgi:cysteine-rich repeat protein